MCSNCPFSPKCLKGWLGIRRIEEILHEDSFICHKTEGTEAHLQCSGHMELVKEGNLFYRLAVALGHQIKLELSGEVFKSKEDCIEHHRNNRDY